ncbi:MAG TPA: helix-turn-helix domain-containing protein [Acidimicrobiales bacterium]
MTNVSEPIGDPTRDRLLAAAGEVFAEKGYDRAGVQEIARRAGFTTGAIYGRFRGKADLLLAAIEAQSQDEFDELFAEYRSKAGGGQATDVLASVGSHLVTDEFDNGKALLLEAFVAARREPELAEMLRQIMEDQERDLTLLIDAAKASGGLDEQLDSFSVVRFCHALALGFLLFGALGLDRPEPVPWEHLIGRLIDAVGPETPAPAAATTPEA